MPRMKFEPTDETRRKVKSLAGFGVSQRQICTLIGIQSVNTLRRHFRTELARGGVEALAKVQQTAFRLATSGRNPRMTMRWLERCAKWAPGMQSRAEGGKPDNVQWRVQVHQPPLAEDDPRRFLSSQLINGPRPAVWDGDDPGGPEEDAR